MDIDRYQTSLLNEKKSKKYLKSLIKLMEKEKPHLDPNMTLQKLSKRIGISKEELSRIINQELFINFNQFLNKYRIKEAKEKLKDTKENQYVILKIAYDVGFNSKSAFNTAFKKNTGHP
jgi:AraC-like DNA-binding protein